MARYFLLFISLIAITLSASAQEDVKVKGRISDQASNEPVPYVNIINKVTGKGTFSNIYGNFSIAVKAGDTLIFSAVGFGKHSMVITQQLKEVYIEIKLSSEAMELRPVRVFAYRDLESLKRAIINLETPLQESEGVALNLPGITPTPPINHDGITGTGVAINGMLSGAINKLGHNKEYNELQKLRKIKEENDRSKMAQVKYNAEIVNEWTSLEGKKLKSFMEFCKLSDDFIIESTTYELAVVVQQCLRDFYEQED
ncbi:MAG: carboxypeptidase-like regulatory domain-containing protein [Candidatus Cyclobacteriaceae bacterium M2_1C_046]